MKAIVRNVLLACLISTFALFGALGARSAHHKAGPEKVYDYGLFTVNEGQRETFTCLAVAFAAWALCLWRCSAINKRIHQQRVNEARFYQYMWQSLLQRKLR